MLVEADAHAGAIERPPLRLPALRRANRTGIEPFLDGLPAPRLALRQAGPCLLLVYASPPPPTSACSSAATRWPTTSACCSGGPSSRRSASSAVIVWITVVNFLYLLTQIVMAVDDVGVRSGLASVVRFLRSSVREIAGIFGVVLLLVLLATVASILATAGLGLIGFVPLVGLAVMPLQIAAWLVRGFVFQYLALTALGAYLDAVSSLPRRHQRSRALDAGQAPGMIRSGQGVRSATTSQLA